MKTLSQ